MIKAGRLNERVIFCELVDTVSSSGSIKKEYIDKYNTRCEIFRNVGNLDVLADEVRAEATIKIRIRYNKYIKDTMRIKHIDNEYDIIHMYHDRIEQSLIITCTKVDK